MQVDQAHPASGGQASAQIGAACSTPTKPKPLLWVSALASPPKASGSSSLAPRDSLAAEQGVPAASTDTMLGAARHSQAHNPHPSLHTDTSQHRASASAFWPAAQQVDPNTPNTHTHTPAQPQPLRGTQPPSHHLHSPPRSSSFCSANSDYMSCCSEDGLTTPRRPSHTSSSQPDATHRSHVPTAGPTSQPIIAAHSQHHLSPISEATGLTPDKVRSAGAAPGSSTQHTGYACDPTPPTTTTTITQPTPSQASSHPVAGVDQSSTQQGRAETFPESLHKALTLLASTQPGSAPAASRSSGHETRPSRPSLRQERQTANPTHQQGPVSASILAPTAAATPSAAPPTASSGAAATGTIGPASAPADPRASATTAAPAAAAAAAAAEAGAAQAAKVQSVLRHVLQLYRGGDNACQAHQTLLTLARTLPPTTSSSGSAPQLHIAARSSFQHSHSPHTAVSPTESPSRLSPGQNPASHAVLPRTGSGKGRLPQAVATPPHVSKGHPSTSGKPSSSSGPQAHHATACMAAVVDPVLAAALEAGGFTEQEAGELRELLQANADMQFAMADLEEQRSWQLIYDEKFRLSYKHLPHTTIHAFKASCILEAPPEHILCLVREVDLARTWNHYATASGILAERGLTHMLAFILIWMPWPFPKMMMQFEASGADMLDLDGSIFAAFSTPSDAKAEALLPAVTKNSKAVHILPRSCLRLEPLPPLFPGGLPRTRVAFQAYADPRIPHLPPAIISFVLRVLTPYLFNAAVQLLRKNFEHGDGPLAVRLRERTDLYGLIRKRVALFLAPRSA
ncbi:MAG: hypothetical protein WDW38_006780 [Sanguina aurantia]